MVVDLAGSENFTDHQDKSLRDEGREVNKSLQALEKVLNDLAESSKTGLNRFIDYRTSKLTEALRGRLGGNNISRILICINPDVEEQFERNFRVSREMRDKILVYDLFLSKF